jgi:hypothetical protein
MGAACPLPRGSNIRPFLCRILFFSKLFNDAVDYWDYTAPMMKKYGALAEWYRPVEMEVIGKQLVLGPVCSTQNPHEFA